MKNLFSHFIHNEYKSYQLKYISEVTLY